MHFRHFVETMQTNAESQKCRRFVRLRIHRKKILVHVNAYLVEKIIILFVWFLLLHYTKNNVYQNVPT